MTDFLGYFRYLYRLPWLLWHVVIDTPLAVLCQTRAGRAIRIGGRPLSDIAVRFWAATSCRIFGVRRKVSGAFRPGAQLVVANHISWLDIVVLHSLEAVGFVAKAEIADWPVVGWLAKVGGTVFHRRGSHDSASGVANALTQRLGEDRMVAIFPEGGILPGEGVKRFHARMFGAAIETGVPVQPVMLRYFHDGKPFPEATFLPGEKTVKNFFRLLRHPGCLADVHILPPIDPAGRQRRELAGEAESRVRAAHESEGPGV
ncbi:MAG: 1-acyl-sn-glycerol-3-phosphate acyltransferase [Gammaproteobacteria bacterium]|nr:1-acyl-sn-glycerol-3-phosphate acyltransferase [Gammaproteobacteria bacterium]